MRVRVPGLPLAVCMILSLGWAAGPSELARAQQSQQTTARVATAPALRAGRYDKSAEVTTSGIIVSIQSQRNGPLPRGTYIVLRSGALTLNVHMGLFPPESIPFASGDQVQITGSLAYTSGGQILLARQVQSASHAVTVRSTYGFVLRPRPADRMQGLQQ